MLNFCGIVAAILKMETGRNFSMSGINSGHCNRTMLNLCGIVVTFWKWRPVEIFRCQESFRDIIIYPHMKCRWNRTMLNLCGIVTAFWKWWLVEIFRCKESFQDIIIYPHVKCRWNRTMLNLCGIVTAILKMVTWYIYWFTSIDWEWLPWYFVCNRFTWKLKIWTGLF
jgi:hypothetical protein